MSSDRPQRVGALLDRIVRDHDGNVLGRIADIVTEPDPTGRERVVALLVSQGPWGRLLGYEHDDHTGPWLLEILARRVLRREVRRVPWAEARLVPEPARGDANQEDAPA